MYEQCTLIENRFGGKNKTIIAIIDIEWNLLEQLHKGFNLLSPTVLINIFRDILSPGL